MENIEIKTEIKGLTWFRTREKMQIAGPVHYLSPIDLVVKSV